MNVNTKPQVIFLDAVGTLFGVKNSVGHVYSEIAKKYNVITIPELINPFFNQSFKAAPPLAFTYKNQEQIKKLEFDWWQKIAQDTFTKAGVIDQFTEFDDFFQELYDYFQTEKPWFIYADVIPSLKLWQQEGIELGIISNFDTRIYEILDHLKLRKYFLTITISSVTGSAKPEAKIFTTALAKHDCEPENAWHIGDSIKEDYWGAKDVGIKSFCLKR